MIRKSPTFLLFVLISLTVSAETSVWKVDRGSSTMYIGGTFHMLRKSDFPLPPEFEVAYKNSASLVFETELGEMQKPGAQLLMMKKGMLDGQILSDVLSPEAYKLLEEYSLEVGIPIDGLKGFKPSMVLLSLAMIELQKLGISEEGVDMHFYRKAKQDGKSTGELESIEEQIEFISKMGEGYEDEFVIHSIQEMEETSELLPELIEYWKTGNRLGMQKEFIDPMKNEFPKLYKSLMVDRNNNWMPKIQALLKTDETEFILVGAAHLVGEDGLLSTLEKLGYKIEKL